jgi:hypothetical protein
LKSRTENFLPDYRLISKTKSTSTTTPHEASLHENASMDEGSIEEASRQEHANQYVLLNQVTRHSEKCFGDVGLGLCDESCCNVKVVFSRVVTFPPSVAMKRSRGGARQASARVKAAHDAIGCEENTAAGNLAKILLQRRAWGELTSTAVQQFAAAAIADGARCQR